MRGVLLLAWDYFTFATSAILNFLHSIRYLQFQICMQSEFYPFQADDSRLYFKFLSVSPEKTIQKIVYFVPVSPKSQIYNLALVDLLPDGSYCDMAITNNHDLEKVMGTVFKCVEAFFLHYPTAEIYFTGSTLSRTRLYRIILSRELSKLVKNYEIYGSNDSCTEAFEPNKNYISFTVKLKNV